MSAYNHTEAVRERVELLRDNGLCVTCGRHERSPMSKWRCEVCLAGQAAQKTRGKRNKPPSRASQKSAARSYVNAPTRIPAPLPEWSQGYVERHRERVNNRVDRLRAEGRCYACGAEPQAGYARCEKCRAKLRRPRS